MGQNFAPVFIDPSPKPNIFLGCFIEYNIDYRGNDIVNMVVDTHQACADFCASTPGGLFWTFGVDMWCYIKSSSSGRKTNQETTSGNRKCGKIGNM